ncbi:DUF3891 family protein [Bacillus sp. HMF5848]|uniref:DUF3891 family protein n=1 Tax=Bacillus sp. HMF5848 TaxID=2495421 RepID=UPI001639B747|nr:DUF3891 family protein [Bacillus sp. HMF5848]
MILYETDTSYVMTEQHLHALVSGDIAKHWDDQLFEGIANKTDVIFAISEHDRGWIEVDASPLWHDTKQMPYTFQDFPLSIKLIFYKKGIDEVQEKSAYAALLCSLHYSSFFKGMHDGERITQFVETEQKRQKKIIEHLKLHTSQKRDELSFHYKLLQFCDDMSLFISIQEPGVSKQDVFPWFRNGFKQEFKTLENQTINAQWLNREIIILTPFPFKEEFEVSLPIKIVRKSEVLEKGILLAYRETPYSYRQVCIRR